MAIPDDLLIDFNINGVRFKEIFRYYIKSSCEHTVEYSSHYNILYDKRYKPCSSSVVVYYDPNELHDIDDYYNDDTMWELYPKTKA